jgi:hypothetical protein
VRVLQSADHAFIADGVAGCSIASVFRGTDLKGLPRNKYMAKRRLNFIQGASSIVDIFYPNLKRIKMADPCLFLLSLKL